MRQEAFRLIEENGDAATTVEQIAEAAEVSPSTFFRYFPTKESVLLADDMGPVIPECAGPTAGWPVAESGGRRIGRDASDFELGVFAGALTGAMMAVYEPGPRAADTVLRVLDFVDAGMPLT